MRSDTPSLWVSLTCGSLQEIHRLHKMRRYRLGEIWQAEFIVSQQQASQTLNCQISRVVIEEFPEIGDRISYLLADFNGLLVIVTTIYSQFEYHRFL